MSRFSILSAALVACATALALGCQDPMAYRFQGVAHYDGRRFLDLEGQFIAITLAPAGDRVAFFGGGDVQGGDGALYVADVAGLVRRVAPAATPDHPIAWAADGRSLFYLGYVPRPDGMLDGATILRYAFDTGAVTQALYAVPLLAFVTSPDGSRLLVGGDTNLDQVRLQDNRNRMLDVQAGTSVRIALEDRPIPGAWGAAWSPDGTHVAIAAPQTDLTEGPATVRVLAAPDWKRGEGPGATVGGTYGAMAWESNRTLRVADLRPDEALVVTRLGTEGQVLGDARAAIDAPPDGVRYWYGRPVPSRDGRRFLVSRQVIDARTGAILGPRAHAIFDDAGRQALEATEDLEPVGWLDDRRILFLAGRYQSRRPVVREVPAT